jgi:hypothetical protein
MLKITAKSTVEIAAAPLPESLNAGAWMDILELHGLLRLS